MQQTQPAMASSLNKLKLALLEDMASQMEQLKKENAELKSHLREIHQSSSQTNVTVNVALSATAAKGVDVSQAVD